MFKAISNREIKFNSKLDLPNYKDDWLEDNILPHIPKMMFLYTYIRMNQMFINGHYNFNVHSYLSLLYTNSTVKSKWKPLVEKLNTTFHMLKLNKLIKYDIVIQNKSDIINILYDNVANQFEDTYYTLIDISVINKIFATTNKLAKDKLLLCCYFLSNRTRKTKGYTSFADIGKLIGSPNTVATYLKWFKDNEIYDYYSTSCKIVDGTPHKGATTVAKWENKTLIDIERRNDTPTSGTSSKDLLALNERFADDKYYKKMKKCLKDDYKLTNNFLLLRLYSEVTYGFNWEGMYKYLNSRRNNTYFNLTDDKIPVQQIDKNEVINKIVRYAKGQMKDVYSYITPITNGIADGSVTDELIGLIHEKELADKKVIADAKELKIKNEIAKQKLEDDKRKPISLNKIKDGDKETKFIS